MQFTPSNKGEKLLYTMHQNAMKKSENSIPNTDWEREGGEDSLKKKKKSTLSSSEWSKTLRLCHRQFKPVMQNLQLC